MRHSLLSFTSGMAAMAVLIGWAGAPPAVGQPAAPAGGGATGITGTVVETMSSGGYTYVQVDDGSKKAWAAAPDFAVAVGDQVVVPEGMAMHDFHSKTLGRTFDVVSFVDTIQVKSGHAANAPAAAHGAGLDATDHGMAGHPVTGHTSGGSAAGIDLSNIKKADGGQTVVELFANQAALAGKQVVVRGRVVKFTPEVMGKNWLHVRDGSGTTGTNDLAVSTGTTAAVGDTVLVRGKLGTNRDLGAGYHYDIIIEDGAVAVE